MASMETGLVVMDGMANQSMIQPAQKTQPVLQMQQIQLIQQQISLTNVLQVNIQKAAGEQEKLNQNVNKSTSSMSALATKVSDTFKNVFNVETLKNGISAIIGEASKMQDKMLSVQGMLGNKDVGTAYFNHLQKQANQSGFSFDELKNNAQSFLGVTKNTESLDKLANLSERLSLGNSAEGMSGAGDAIKSMMSGDGSSLEDKFGFSSEDIGILQASKDLDDFTSKFDGLLDGKGLNDSMLDNFNNSASAQFENLKENFDSTLGQIGIGLLEAITPILQMLNEMFSSGEFQGIIEFISLALVGIGEVISWICEGIINNWDIIGPILAGLAAAVLTLGIITLGYNIVQGISNLLTAEKATVDAAATASQWGLNMAILACPLTWIIIAIVAVIAALIAWSIHTNGLQVTWLMFMNTLLTIWDSIKLNAVLFVNSVINGFDRMCIGAMSASVGIRNALGNMKADGLMILQNFVNGSIDLINDLISLVNKIPGVGIQAISHVTFGTQAQVDNQAEQAARNAELSDYINRKNDEKQAREDKYNNMLSEATARRIERDAKIAQVKSEAEANKNKDNNILDMFDKFQNSNELPMNSSLGTGNNGMSANNSGGMSNPLYNAGDGLSSSIDNTNLGNNVADVSENLKGMDDNVEVSNEHLEMMKDLAEQESIQNFVSLTPTVQVTTGDIKEEADINTIISKIESYMENEMINSAEGLYA